MEHYKRKPPETPADQGTKNTASDTDLEALIKAIKSSNKNNVTETKETRAQLSKRLGDLTGEYQDSNFFQKKYILSELKMIQKEIKGVSGEIEGERKEFSRTYAKVIKQLEKSNSLSNKAKSSLMGDKQNGSKLVSSVMDATNPYVRASIQGLSKLAFGKSKKSSSEEMEKNIDRIRSRSDPRRDSQAKEKSSSGGISEEMAGWQKTYFAESSILLKEISQNTDAVSSTLKEFYKTFIDFMKDIDDAEENREKGVTDEDFKLSLEYLDEQLTALNKVNVSLEKMMDKAGIEEPTDANKPKAIKGKISATEEEEAKLANEYLNEILTTQNDSVLALKEIETDTKLSIEFLDGIWSALKEMIVGKDQEKVPGALPAVIKSNRKDDELPVLEKILANSDTLVRIGTDNAEASLKSREGVQKMGLESLSPKPGAKSGGAMAAMTDQKGEQKGESFFSKLFDTMLAVALEPIAMNMMKGVAGGAVKFGKGIMGFLVDSIKGIGGKMFEGVKTVFSGVGKMLGGVSELAGEVGKFAKYVDFAKAIPIVGDVIMIISSIIDFFTGFMNADKILGKAKDKLNIGDRLAAGIGSFIGGIIGIVDSIAGVFGIKTDLGGKVTKSVATYLDSAGKSSAVELPKNAKAQQAATNDFIAKQSGNKVAAPAVVHSNVNNSKSVNTTVVSSPLTSRSTDPWAARYSAGNAFGTL